MVLEKLINFFFLIISMIFVIKGFNGTLGNTFGAIGWVLILISSIVSYFELNGILKL